MNEHKVVTLEEIFGEDKVVLVDAGMCGEDAEEHGFGWKIGDTKKFSGVSQKEAREEIRRIEEFKAILEMPGAYTIQKVTSCIEAYVRHIGHQLRVFADSSDFGRSEKHALSGRQVLQEVEQSVFELWQLSRAKEIERSRAIEIDKRSYDFLVDMVKILDRAIELKKDTRYVYQERDLPNTDGSDKDERLVGLLYYLSMFKDISPAILTCDTNFVRLLGVTPKLIGAFDFLPYNNRFIEAMQIHPFTLYFEDRTSREFQIVVSGDKVVAQDAQFRVYSRPEEEDSAKRGLMQLWKDFVSTYETATVH